MRLNDWWSQQFTRIEVQIDFPGDGVAYHNGGNGRIIFKSAGDDIDIHLVTEEGNEGFTAHSNPVFISLCESNDRFNQTGEVSVGFSCDGLSVSSFHFQLSVLQSSLLSFLQITVLLLVICIQLIKLFLQLLN